MLTTIDFHRAVARIKTLSGDGGGSPPVTQPSIVDSTLTEDESKDSTAITMPTHATNDILVVFSASAKNINMSGYSYPAGWTGIQKAYIHVSASAGSYAYFWKRATSSSETLTMEQFAGGASKNRTTIVFSVRDCITSGSPWDVHVNTSHNSSTTQDSHNITPTVTGGLAIFLCGFQSAQTMTTSPPPTGWTLVDGNTASAREGEAYVTALDAATEASTQIDAIQQGVTAGGETIRERTSILLPNT